MFYKKIPGLVGAIKRHGAVLWPRLTPSRLLNICLANYEMQRKVTRVRSRPFMAKIEASSACNLRCDGCRSGQNQIFDYSSGNLTVENFETMMEKLGPYLLEILFYLWGEPLINKKLPQLINIAHRWNVSTAVSTNLHYLDENMGRGLIESQLDKMVICIDGLSQDSYAAVRKGGDLQLVMDNTLQFLKMRKTMRSRKPLIEWQYIVTDKTKSELSDARRMSKEWGIERFVEIVDWSKRLTNDEQYFQGLREARRKMRRSASCFWLWTSIAVQYDGTVFPCCHTAAKREERRIFGSLISEDLDAVWNNEQYQQARQSFAGHTTTNGDNSKETRDIICDHCATPPIFSERPEPKLVELTIMDS